jgi:hypothetical protein
MSVTRPILFVICMAIAVASIGQMRGTRSIPPTVRQLVDADEIFEYRVEYGIFTLGTVTIEVVKDTTWKGRPAFILLSKIKSNPRLLFVGDKERHFISVTGYDNETFFCHDFHSNSIHDRQFRDTEYKYDYDRGFVIGYEFGKEKGRWRITEPSDSGPGLFYVTRLFAGRDTLVNYPIITEFEKGVSRMRFTSLVEPRDIPFFAKGPVPAYRMNGQADLKGPFGFSGAFTAWYGTDPMRLPYEAHVKVWVGNVIVRLVDYKRLK